MAGRIARREQFFDRLVEALVFRRAPLAAASSSRGPSSAVAPQRLAENRAASRVAVFFREGLIHIGPRASGCEAAELHPPKPTDGARRRRSRDLERASAFAGAQAISRL